MQYILGLIPFTDAFNRKIKKTIVNIMVYYTTFQTHLRPADDTKYVQYLYVKTYSLVSSTELR